MEGQLFKIASDVGTPMSIAALIVIALYLLYKAVLKLPIFVQLTREKTFAIVDSVINKVFILALIALVLGVCAYMYSQYLSSRGAGAHKTEHVLKLVDVSNADEEAPKGSISSGSLSLEGLKEAEAPDIKFPVADIKLRNAGDNTLFLKRLTVLVDKAEPDTAPHFDARAEIDSSNNMSIVISNEGWGPGREVTLWPVAGKLCNYLTPPICESPWQGEIQDKVTIPIPKSAIDLVKLGDLRPVALGPDGRVSGGKLTAGTMGRMVEYEYGRGRQMIMPTIGHGEIKYKDPQDGTIKTESLFWLIPGKEDLWLTDQGFIIVYNYRQYEYSGSSEEYNILLKFEEKTPREQTYTISHSIEPNKVERFQVIFASEKSMYFTIRFRIHFDEDSTLETPPLEFHVINPKPGGVPARWER